MSETCNCVDNTFGEDSKGTQTSSRSTSSIYQKSNKSEKLTKHHNSNKENEGSRLTLLSITVEIEDGCSGHIQMKEGDSAEGVAIAFCRDYSLPDDFVAPLTEHILHNIINISKKDKNIIFCSTEEREAYEARLKQTTPGNYPDENSSSHEKKSTESGGQCQDSDSTTPLAQSQIFNRPSFGAFPMLSPRTLMKTRTMLAQRLQCPTHSSRSKALKAENVIRRKRRMSDITKVRCLRLYNDFLDRKQRSVQNWRQNAKQYNEKVDRTKIKSPKKSWRIHKKRSEIAKRYRNYGELLYTEGLMVREKLLKEIEKKKKEDEEWEMVGFTGMPKISERARQLRRANGDVWDKLASEKFNYDHIRDEVMEIRMAECTFMPHVNPSSNEPTDASISRFEQLFFDSESRRRRQQQYADWYPEELTFQPAINRRINDEEFLGEEGCQVSVFDRLSISAKKLQEKKAMEQDSGICFGIDDCTGREMFTPQTGRKPQTARNPKNLPVGVFLHEMQAARRVKKEAMVEKEEQTVRDQAKCRYVTPQSQKLLTQLKPRAFKQMFDALDTDKDGFIQLSKVDTRRVSADAAQDINSLIKSGKGNDRLTFDTFHCLMHEIEEKCHKGSTVRGNLRHVSHVDNSNMTFDYKVPCRLSSDLANKRRNYSTSDEWYNIILRDDEKRQQKVEALRKERQRIEMQECTFAPEFLTKPIRRSNLKHHNCSRPRSAPQPVKCPGPTTIVEKATKDMHGFVFQDDASCGCKEPDNGADDGADDKPDDGADDKPDGADSTLLPSSGLFSLTQPSLIWQQPEYWGPQGFQSLSVSNLPANVKCCRQRAKLRESLRSLSKRRLSANMCPHQTALVEHFRIHDHMVASKHAQTDNNPSTGD
ncbi:hypothetical protein KC19_10G018400 [Ceratodon purpureus]|uniref:EF-hand domain-containing protein n=1 Tax=Ceratodon purpureus TaxID=3225 RepID=A0A8T0GFV7_CERPU|nr:hypothetical protein KC19_10G018400 [Ceratodon purpureus]